MISSRGIDAKRTGHIRLATSLGLESTLVGATTTAIVDCVLSWSTKGRIHGSPSRYAQRKDGVSSQRGFTSVGRKGGKPTLPLGAVSWNR